VTVIAFQIGRWFGVPLIVAAIAWAVVRRRQRRAGAERSRRRSLFAVGKAFVVALLLTSLSNLAHDGEASLVAARTTVSIPRTAAGLPLRTDAAGERLVQRLKALPFPGRHLAGAYGGTTGPEAVVGITKRVMSLDDQRNYLGGSGASALRLSAHATPFGPIDAGSLGGEVKCSSTATVTLCLFVDAGAYGMVVVYDTRERALRLVAQLRASVEQHV
jgi:hypothetical protein